MASATMNQNLLDQEAPLIEEVRNSTQKKTDSQNNWVVAVSNIFGFIYFRFIYFGNLREITWMDASGMDVSSLITGH